MELLSLKNEADSSQGLYKYVPFLMPPLLFM